VQPDVRVKGGKTLRGADIPRVLARPLAESLTKARKLKVLWVDNLWVDGQYLLSHGGVLFPDADDANFALEDARVFGVERDPRPAWEQGGAADDAGMSALVTFIALRRPRVKVLALEGSLATVNAACMEALGRHPTLEHLSMAHADAAPRQLAPLLNPAAFASLKSVASFSLDFDAALADAKPDLRIRPFADFGSGFAGACRRAGVAGITPDET